MTRKDFQLIADVLAQAGQHNAADPDVREGWHAALAAVGVRFADVLAETNQRFDRARFLAACRPKGADVRQAFGPAHPLDELRERFVTGSTVGPAAGRSDIATAVLKDARKDSRGIVLPEGERANAARYELAVRDALDLLTYWTEQDAERAS